MSKHLTKKQLEELKNDLIELRKRLLEEVKSHSSNVSSQVFSAGNITDSTHDDDFAEAGSETYEREKDQAIVEYLKSELQKVEESLSRMESGDYGVCRKCGAHIPFGRLKAIPYTDLCLECKKKEV